MSKKNTVSTVKGNKHTLNNDAYLHLFGSYSVVGRSFVTEDKDGVKYKDNFNLNMNIFNFKANKKSLSKVSTF